MASPNVNLGQLNRLSASVTWRSNPTLNVTPPYLAKGAIRLAPDGDATKFIEVLTGVVPSPEPYQMITITINLVKTTALAAAYQSQFQLNTLLGNGTVRPDIQRGTGGLQPFDIYDCGLMTPRELDFSGEDANFPVVVRGYWSINSSLYG